MGGGGDVYKHLSSRDDITSIKHYTTTTTFTTRNADISAGAYFYCQVFASMDELLRKAPMVYSISSRSRSELHRLWQEWRSECIRRRDGGDFVGAPWLNKIVKVRQITTTFNN